MLSHLIRQATGFLVVTSLIYGATAFMAPESVEAKPSSVASIKVSLNPPNPQPGDTFHVEVTGTGGPGSWCRLNATVDIPGLGLSVTHSGTVQRGAAHGLSLPSFTFTVPANAGEGISLAPVVNISGCGGGSGYRLPTGVSTPSVASVPKPAFTVEKSAPGVGEYLFQGQSFDYSMVVTNTGNAPAANTTLIDDLDLTYLTFHQSDADVETDNGATRKLQWNFGTLQPGERRVATISVQVKTTVPSGTIIRNSATAKSGSVEATSRVFGKTVHDGPLLKLTKGIDRLDQDTVSRSPGDSVTYVFELVNQGQETATNVIVQDQFEALENITLRGLADANAMGVSGSPPVGVWTIGELARGERITLKATGTLRSDVSADPDDGGVVNKAVVTSDNAVQPTVESNETVIIVAQEPQIAFTKRALTPYVQPGQLATFELKVENIGTVNANAIWIQDPIDGVRLTEPVAALVTGQMFMYGNLLNAVDKGITAYIPELKVGQSHSFVYTAKVPDDAVVGSTSTNSAYSWGANMPSATAAFPLWSKADFSIFGLPVLDTVKSAAKPEIGIGEEVIFTITVTNTGNEVTNGGVTMTDLVDERLDIVRTNPPMTSQNSVTIGGQTLTELAWNNFKDLKPRESHTVEVTVTPRAGLGTAEAGINLSDTARASSSFNGGSLESPPASAKVRFEPKAKPVITKTASVPTDQPIQPGRKVTYTLTVRPPGSDPITDVTVTDMMPPGLVFDHSVPSPDARSTDASGNQIFEYIFPKLENTATITLVAKIADNVQSGEKVSNFLAASTPNLKTEVVTEPVSHTVFDAGYTLTKKVQGSRQYFQPGDTLTYSLTYSNVGKVANTGTVITDILSPWLESVPGANPAYTSTPLDPADPGSAEVLKWTIGKVAPGKNHTVSFEARVKAGTPDDTVINNTAHIYSAQTGEIASNTVTVHTEPVELRISKTINSPDGNYNDGDALTYTINYANIGQVTAPNTVLTDPLPTLLEGFEFTGVDGAVYDAASHTVSLNIGNLLPRSADASIIVHGVARNPGTSDLNVGNRATITSTDAGVVKATASAKAELTVKPGPLFIINKTIEGSDKRATAKPGETVHYELLISKRGGAATEVRVVDKPPAALENLQSNHAFTINVDGAMVFVLPAMAEGDVGPLSVTISGEVRNPTDPGSFPNVAAVTAKELLGSGIASNTVDLLVNSQPDLVVSKSVDKSVVNSPTTGLGEQLTYTLTVENNGTANATDVVVTDDLSDKFTDITSPDTTSDVNGNSVRWLLGVMQPGARQTLTVSARAKPGLNAGLTIPNKAAVSGLSPDGSTHNSESGEVNVKVGVARLFITKTADKASVAPGESLVWTIEYANTGTADTGPITLSDTLPAALSYVTGSAAYPAGSVFATAANNGVVFSDLPSLAAGEKSSVSFTTVVAAIVPRQSAVLQNTVLASATQVPSSLTPPLTDPPKVSTGPSLKITKTADVKKTHPGDTLTYTITATNVGSDKANNIEISDKLTDLLMIKSYSGKPQLSGQTLTWSELELAAKDSLTYTVTAKVVSPLADGKVIPNTVTVTSTEEPVGKSATVYLPVRAPSLRLVKTASLSTVKAGDAGAGNGGAFSYLITVTNNGSGAASNITVTDDVPTALEVLSVKGLSGNCGVSNQLVTCAIPLLAAGDSVDIHIKVKARDALRNGLPINNQATVSSPTTGSITTPPTTVTVSSAPRLTLTKSTPAVTVSPGALMRYTLLIENTGSDIATGYTVTDRLPQYTSFDSASDGGVESGGVVTWGGAGQPLLPDIAPGGSHTLTLDVLLASSIPNKERIANTAQLHYPVSGKTLQVASSLPPGGQHPLVASAPRLKVLKSVDGGATTVVPGQLLTYILTVSNEGNAPANAVTLIDKLPSEVTWVPGAQGADSSQLPTLSWDLGTVDPGSPKSITVSARVASPLVNGSKVVNGAEVQLGGVTVDSTSVTQYVVSAPRLSISKTPLKQKARAGTVVSGAGQQDGEGVAFQISYDNTGNETSTNVIITDKLDPKLRFISASHGGQWDPGSRTISWAIGSLEPGRCQIDTCSVSVQAQVGDGIANGTAIENYAHIGSSEGAKTSKRAVVKVHSEGRLAVQKSVVGSAVVAAGKRVKYLIEYANVGSDALTDVTVSDHLAPGTTLDYASDGGVLSGKNVLWFNGANKTLAAGSGGVLHLTVLMPTVVSNGAALENKVTVSGSTATGRVAASATALVTAASAPRLTLSKSGPKTKAVQADQLITYVLTLENQGNDVATGVVVTDTLPSGLSFASASDGGAPDSNDPQVVRWSFGNKALPPGLPVTLSVTARVNSPIADNTRLDNRASTTDHVTNTIVNSNIVQRTVTSRPYLEIDKTLVGTSGPVTLGPGDPVTFLLTFANTGSDTATNVVVEDHLPIGLRLSATEDVDGVSAVVSGSVLRWSIGTLLPGQSRSVHVYGVVESVIPNGSTLDNFASIVSAETKPKTAHAPLITVASAPAIALNKTTQVGLVSPDLQYTYEIDWFNFGADTATTAVLKDCLPSGVTFVGASYGGTAAGSCGSNQQQVIWNLGDVRASTGGAVFVTVIVDDALQVQNGDALTNLVDVGATKMPATSSSHTVIVSSRPALALVERTSAPVIAAGDAVLYTLTFANFGNAVATGVQVTDELPPDAIPQSVSSGGKFDLAAGKVIWDIGSLPPGGSVTVTYSLASPTGTPEGTVWLSTSNITATNAWPTSAQSEVYIGSVADFDLTKTGPSAVEAGETATWRIDYFNSGNGNANGAVIQDVIPAGWTLVGSNQVHTESGNVVSWSVGAVPALSGGYVDVTLRAPAVADNGSAFINTASLQTTGANQTWTAYAPMVIHSHTDLAVTIDAQRTPVKANTEQTLDVTWANTGNQDAPNARIQVTLPTNTQFVSATGAYTVSGSTVTWEVTDALSGGGTGLPSGGTGAESIVVKVDDGTINGTVLKSQAEITADTGTPAIDVTKFEVVSAPVLVLAKAVDQQQVEVGNIVTYTIDVANQGNEDATGLVISDQLPPELRLIDSSTPGAVVDTPNNRISLDVGVLEEPMGTATLVFRARVLASASNKTIPNTAEVSCNELPNALSTATTDVSELIVVPVPTGNRVWLLMLVMLMVAGVYWHAWSGRRLSPR
ncbi:MAG: hypothetical protein VW686_04895 [Luminiphilus sp.]